MGSIHSSLVDDEPLRNCYSDGHVCGALRAIEIYISSRDVQAHRDVEWVAIGELKNTNTVQYLKKRTALNAT